LQAVLLFSLVTSGFIGANVVFYLYSNKFWCVFFCGYFGEVDLGGLEAAAGTG
jgi:hypothetical protein